MRGIIFDIKEMAVHDGPGIRTTVFFKGCPLRCRWCHNPEGLSFEKQLMVKKVRCTGCGQCRKQCSHKECQPFGRCIHVCANNCLEIAGKEITACELAEELKSSAEILGNDFGGFTFSGGEPLAQPRFLLELAECLKNYHLCIETSGFAESSVFKSVIDKMDYVIMDVKIADNQMHKQYTGVSNKQILKNFHILKESGKPHLIRTPMIPNITDTHENLAAIEMMIQGSQWEKIPFNAAAGAKYEMLNMKWNL